MLQIFLRNPEEREREREREREKIKKTKERMSVVRHYALRPNFLVYL